MQSKEFDEFVFNKVIVNGTPLGDTGRPTQVLTHSYDMEELRPDLLPVSSSTTTTTTLASDTLPTITTTTNAPSQVGGGGGGTVVNSGHGVVSTAVRAQQTQDLVRLPPPPSKGAVPVVCLWE